MFVSLIQQGMVSDQKVVAVGRDEASLLKEAEAKAEELNDRETGFGEAWAAVVLPVK